MTSAFTPKVRWIIINRDSDDEGNPVCTWCGGVVRIEWGEYSLQHRRARAMGGSRLKDTGQPQNGTLLHGSATTGCHSHVERNPQEAADRGFRIRQGQNPLTAPIIDADGHRWWLRADGTKTNTPPH